MRFVVAMLLASCVPETDPGPRLPAVQANAELPGDSLYLLDKVLVDPTGRATTLERHRGRPVLVTMFYASCPMACPLLIDDIQGFERSLEQWERQELQVVLISLDPDRDTPEVLDSVMRERALDATRWTLLSPEPEDVREIAVALGIRYRPSSDGAMNHSSILTLLDQDGRPVARVEGIRSDSKPLSAALEQVLAALHLPGGPP